MKLQQLRFLIGVVDHELNMTAAAESLFTSQPGVSKQLRSLEQELGVQLFHRQGRKLTGLTKAGRSVVPRARRVLREIDGIRTATEEHRSGVYDSLSIATTHTQARYVLPEILTKFRERFPDVTLNLHQGTSEQIADMIRQRSVDIAMATGSEHLFVDLERLPCFQWDRVILVPTGHELASRNEPIDLATLARYPLVTYVFSAGRESSLHRAFSEQGHEPDVVFTARDADVIKTYVKLGMGVGIVASMAYECDDSNQLEMIEVPDLFPRQTTWFGWHKDRSPNQPMVELLRLVAPWLSEPQVLAMTDGNASLPQPDCALPVLSGCQPLVDCPS
ncbi:MAG: LysR substrate-binding domain-containing protein [Pseudomonadota bacterium]